MDKILQEKASSIVKNAYAPYSKFQVGACIKTESNSYHAGCNVENVSYGLTMCAEASAIAHMVASNERIIREIYIVADSDQLCSPCGSCRQLIREFSNTETKIHVANQLGNIKTFSIAELLPCSFGPEMLEGL